MLIVLPPSETKAHGGMQAPLDLQKLSFSSLNPVREQLINELSSLEVEEAIAVLGVSEKLRTEVESNRHLRSSPSMPAVLRYTGVLFDALDAPSLEDYSSLAIGDALFGLIGGADPIPHYRLSGGNKLAGRTLKSWWGTAITEALEGVEGLVLDLRSGVYQNLGKLPTAVTLRVETTEGKVVSHFNKHYKGLLARELVLAGANCGSAEEVAAVAQETGLDVRLRSPQNLIMVVNR